MFKAIIIDTNPRTYATIAKKLWKNLIQTGRMKLFRFLGKRDAQPESIERHKKITATKPLTKAKISS